MLIHLLQDLGSAYTMTGNDPDALWDTHVNDKTVRAVLVYTTDTSRITRYLYRFGARKDVTPRFGPYAPLFVVQLDGARNQFCATAPCTTAHEA